MSLLLPASSSPINDLFEVADLACKRWVPLPDALQSAKRQFAADPAVKSVQYLVIRSDDRVQLIRVGKRGGWKSLFTFGKAPA